MNYHQIPVDVARSGLYSVSVRRPAAASRKGLFGLVGVEVHTVKMHEVEHSDPRIHSAWWGYSAATGTLYWAGNFQLAEAAFQLAEATTPAV